MAKLNIVIPSLGEGITDVTLIKWLVSVGTQVDKDEPIAEVATDKVDTEIFATASGTISSLLHESGAVIEVGFPLAVIEVNEEIEAVEIIPTQEIFETPIQKKEIESPSFSQSELNNIFLSPLVKSIVKSENISNDELKRIRGKGLNNRITRDDILHYLSIRNTETKSVNSTSSTITESVVEMDRVRKLIAENMIRSKQIAPHVTSFIEADVTNMQALRESMKAEYHKKYGQKLTLTHLFIQEIAKTLKNYPYLNASVIEDKIYLKKEINIGLATALPNGNLIVPVLKNAEKINLKEIVQLSNDLFERARNNKLKIDEVRGGTFSVTNLGAFGTLTGTPIINQPEVAILAIGAAIKRVSVIETPQGDLIGIRQKVMLSLSYDHRIIDGALAGLFLKELVKNIESIRS